MALAGEIVEGTMGGGERGVEVNEAAVADGAGEEIDEDPAGEEEFARMADEALATGAGGEEAAATWAG